MSIHSLRYFAGIVLGSSTELNEVPLDPPVVTGGSDMHPDGPAEGTQDWGQEEWEVATGGSDMLPDGLGMTKKVIRYQL